MMKKVLTYLTILAITTLPVQLISANTESINMQISMLKSMSQQPQVTNECMHEMEEQQSIDRSCCDEQSHECQNCNNCPQAVSALFIGSAPTVKITSLNTNVYILNYSFLNGITQKNLLRPPRIII
ncbi:MAG: hypothetical protein OEW99_11975 [Gammaproteobacteria bacterium]|nr:hypothetical protein [Gammaproteobacteria bacterium]